MELVDKEGRVPEKEQLPSVAISSESARVVVEHQTRSLGKATETRRRN